MRTELKTLSGLCQLLLALLLAAPRPAVAVETLIASYEPGDSPITVTPGWQDTGLTVACVPGGIDGAPAATSGTYVLKLAFENEDGKIEFRQDWLTATYSLAGYETLLADVYIQTASALPGLIGIWTPQWDPPDAWQSATSIPTAIGQWITVSFDVSTREQTGLDQIFAFVLEDMPGATGVAYVDNLRLYRDGDYPVPVELAANAFDTHTELAWKLSENMQPTGYNVYRADNEAGPFVQLNSTPHPDTLYSEDIGNRTQRYYYYVTAVYGETETIPSNTVSARFNGLEDEELLNLVQAAAFGYFWLYGHPTCGAARDSYNGWTDTIASGGTGMGIMSIIAAAERGFITRAEAAERVRLICEFLEDTSDRFHGAWPHWMNGTTGATIPFSTYDDGADLVETAYVVQGLLTARQYFDGTDATETEIRTRATRMWEAVEWDWFLRDPGSEILWWHWSPNYGWTMNLPITGYDETMIAYLLAIASPTHPIPASAYYNGWARQWYYVNGAEYYGIKQWVGPVLGGPLFFTHYSALGFDPRFWRDDYCNFHDNSRNISLIHQAYSIDNPSGFEGYNRWAWGLTASESPPPTWYSAHCPTNDNGTISPTAALSAIAYTPDESLAAMRYFYDVYGAAGLWGPYGFTDAFNPTEDWFSTNYLSIDQGPIVIMIENYRTGLCWRLFMSNPEIKTMLQAIGWTLDGDFDADGSIDATDLNAFAGCMTGPAGITACPAADLDLDADADMQDFTRIQRAASQP